MRSSVRRKAPTALTCFGATPSTKKTFTWSCSFTWSDHETTQDPSAIRSPRRNIPIRTVIVSANDVERFDPIDRKASDTTSFSRLVTGESPGDVATFLAHEEQARLGRREPPYRSMWTRLRRTRGAAHRARGTWRT